jgi:hypothetical protein
MYDIKPSAKEVRITVGRRSVTIPIPTKITTTAYSPQTINGVEEGPIDVANRYLETIPRKSRMKILTIMTDLKAELMEYPCTRERAKEITATACDSILSLPGIDLEKVHAWNQKHMTVPSTIRERFSKDSKKSGHSREQTYVVDEYLELTTLATMMKILFPPIYMYLLWDYNTSRAGDGTKGSGYRQGKSTYVDILYNIVPRTLLEYKAYIKLQRFAEQAGSKVEVPVHHMLNEGMSSETKFEYVMGEMMIRKLPLCTLMNNHGRKNVVTHLYSAVEQMFRIGHRQRLTPKAVHGAGNENLTISESYKIPQSHSIPNQVQMEYVAGLEFMLGTLGRQVPKGEVRSLYRKLKNQPIHTTAVHAKILSSLFLCMLEEETFDIIDPPTFMGLCVIGHFLIRDEHPQLARLLVSGYKVTMEDNNPIVSPYNLRVSPLSEDRHLYGEFKYYFPFYRTTGDEDKNLMPNKKHLMLQELTSYTDYLTYTFMDYTTMTEWNPSTYILHDIARFMMAGASIIKENDNMEKLMNDEFSF